jgi:anaerobic C4-dicarboxylate transporter
VSAGNPRFYAIFFPSLVFFFVIVLGTLIVVIPLMVRTVRVVKQRRIRYHRPAEDDPEGAAIDINAGVEEWHGSDNEDGERRGSGDY